MINNIKKGASAPFLVSDVNRIYSPIFKFIKANEIDLNSLL
ncbi:MAG: hypothetical protein ACJAVY_002205, partial [Marinoscillum sp.]